MKQVTEFTLAVTMRGPDKPLGIGFTVAGEGFEESFDVEDVLRTAPERFYEIIGRVQESLGSAWTPPVVETVPEASPGEAPRRDIGGLLRLARKHIDSVMRFAEDGEGEQYENVAALGYTAAQLANHPDIDFLVKNLAAVERND